MSWLENKEREHSYTEIFSFLLPYLVKRKIFLVFVSVVSFFAAILGLIAPILIGRVVDVAIPAKSINLIWILGGSIFIAALFGGILQYVSRFYAALFAEKVIFELRNDIYGTLQQLSLTFYDEESTGQIMTRVTTDLQAIQTFVNFTLRLLMNGLILFFGSYIAMFIINFRLGAVLTSLFPGFIALIIWFSVRVRPVFYETRRQFGTVTSILQENVTGNHVVRGFAQEQHEIDKFKKANALYRDLRIKSQIYRAYYTSGMILLIGLGTALVLFVGGRQVMTGTMGRGELITFFLFLQILPAPTRQLTWLVGIFQRSLASGDRIIELLEAQKEVQDDPNALDIRNLEGDIKYENVTFQYERDRPILHNLNIHIPAGQKLVIFGGTGSGKSSFVNLLSRFYDPTHGVIKIDDNNIQKYKLKQLRKNIGMVLQETFLFNATIKENIAFGRPDATDEEIFEASKTAKIYDFIASLPNGFETRVGDRGITLSGGQKQRISIARSLLINPSILIFDDSTASVDAETEAHIQEALSILSEGRTTLIISQRVSSVRYADRILIFDRGEIIQDGSHEELISQPGIYHDIYSTLAQSYETPPVVSESVTQKDGGSN